MTLTSGETFELISTGGADATYNLSSDHSLLTIIKKDSGAGRVIIRGSIDGRPEQFLINQDQFIRLLRSGDVWTVVGGN